MSPRFHHNAIPRRGIAFEILRFVFSPGNSPAPLIMHAFAGRNSPQSKKKQCKKKQLGIGPMFAMLNDISDYW